MPSLSQDKAIAIIRRVLDAWHLEGIPLTVKAQTQNWVFETVLPDGRKAIVRVKPSAFPMPPLTVEGLIYTGRTLNPESLVAGRAAQESSVIPAPPQSNCEFFMLRTLGQKTSLVVPRLMPRDDHADMLAYSYGEEGDWEIAVFTYLPGETRTPQTLTARDAARAGAFLAQLHTESRRLIFHSPADAALDAEGLLGRTSRYASPEEKLFLSPADQAVLDTLKQRLTDVEALVGENSEHTLLLHGDYLLQNIVFDEDTVGALDFEMCGWGVDLYDLATFLWQMKPSPHYSKIEEAFWQGYTFWRELPPRDWLEIFITARQGASVRWLIQNRHLPAYAERVPSLIRQRIDEISGFLDTGVLKKRL